MHGPRSSLKWLGACRIGNMPLTNIVVWAADVGSISKRNFGWCRDDNNSQTLTGQDIAEFARGIADDLSTGKRIALGFECPLFVPIADAPDDLTKARDGEKNRAWSAGAGSGALATGLTECVWIFERIRELARTDIRPTFEWEVFASGNANLLVWEALVTRSDKGRSHIDDARIAVRAFWTHFPNIESANSVTAVNAYSLAGAGLIRAKLSTDISLLFQPCIVLAAGKNV